MSPSDPAPARGVLRLWPWWTSLIAAAIVVLAFGVMRRFDFIGINGFSTMNYGWLAFSLVGGAVLAWRLARAPGPWWGIALRALIAPAIAFALCFLLVTLMGLIFLPQQSIATTLTTDAPGRAIWIGLGVLVLSALCEIARAAIRAIRGRAGTSDRPR